MAGKDHEGGAEHHADWADSEPSGIGTGLGICGLLADMSPDALLALEQACDWLRLPPHHLLFRHDDPPDAVYFVVSGSVRAFMPVQDGMEVNYALFGPGDMVGELAVLDGRERSADVMTVTHSVIAACPRVAFLEVLRHNPEFSLRLLVRLANIIRQSSQRIAEISSLNDVQRVYLELLRLAVPDPVAGNCWVIRPVPLHKEIAGWAATTTDMVGRALGHLMKTGLVQRRAGGLHILDRKRVETMAREHDAPPI